MLSCLFNQFALIFICKSFALQQYSTLWKFEKVWLKRERTLTPWVAPAYLVPKGFLIPSGLGQGLRSF